MYGNHSVVKVIFSLTSDREDDFIPFTFISYAPPGFVHPRGTATHQTANRNSSVCLSVTVPDSIFGKRPFTVTCFAWLVADVNVCNPSD
jgi:hypothetical protein